ncbi:hypothetical protein HC928_14355 [bacterium]|nr:hypothetical protein [bacterium]
MTLFGNRRPNTTDSTLPGDERPPVSSSPTTGFETVLGASSAFEGTLSSQANLRLDGTFTGTLNITGQCVDW